MEDKLSVARLFSVGKFDQVATRLADDVEFHIYEDDKHLIGKAQVMVFCDDIGKYFASVETDFRELGHLVDESKVVIYGYGEFRRDGELISAVHSCDVYEFNSQASIAKIHSYCNSGLATKTKA
jgi:hypothetical protein